MVRASTSRSRALLASITLLAGTLVSLVLGEIAIRVATNALHRIPIVRGHSVMGWTAWPNLERAAKTYRGGTFRLTTDSNGRRVSYPVERHDAARKPVVVILGDSFVQGVGVEDHETSAWQLARALPDRQVVNLGVAGYGTDQQLLSLEEFASSSSTLISDVVVIAYENDFRDVQNRFDYALARSKPRFVLGKAGLEREEYEPSVLDRLMDGSRLVWLARTKVEYWRRPAPLSPDSGVDLVIACLGEIRKLATIRSARVHLFAYRQIGPPFGDSAEVGDALWSDFIRRSGATDLADAIVADDTSSPVGFDRMHWSAEGNRRVSRRILEALNGSHP